ncbi:MAG: hypothetical protein HGA87_00885 [Desulfobulbaceae bacterium]|nr:hypothetical protein [Desulfobulbaceae bacterium]
MSVENFEVERVGTTVKIWMNSGAEVEKRMIAFSREFSTEIEADLVRQNIEWAIEGERLAYFRSGEKSAQDSLSKQAENAVNELINKHPF